MSNYRTLNQIVLVKAESSTGTDASPVVGTNAVKVESPTSPADLQTQDTNEVTGALDVPAPIPTGGSRSFTTRVYNKGSGTAGTVPEADPLLRGCGLVSKTLASAATGTAQAGASGTITLASGASSTNNIYQGHVIETTGGTGPDQKRIITAYNGTTKVATVLPAWTVTPDATTTYAVRAGNVYTPTSTLETVTIYQYYKNTSGGNDKLCKTLGAAGNFRLNLSPNQASYFDFDFRGSLIAPTDVSSPGTPTYVTTTPPPFLAAQVYLDSTKLQMNSLQIDSGNEVTLEDDPNADFGYANAGITRRRIGGTMVAPKDLESNRNVFNSWKNGTAYTLTAVWGSTAGNRCSLMLTNVTFIGATDQDVKGFAYDSLPFRLNASNSGVWLGYW
jgi:hypothetical protein